MKFTATQYKEKANQAMYEIFAELQHAKAKYSDNFNSQHEAYAVILEEVDELWDEVKKKSINYDLENQRKEAVQIAAMTIRFIVELT